MQVISNSEKFLPLEILNDDVSILLLDVDFVPSSGYSFKYYTVNKDNTLPYNERSEIVERLLESFFEKLFEENNKNDIKN